MGFPSFNRATWSPADEAVAINTTVADHDLGTTPSRGLYVGGAGDVKVEMAKAGTVTFKTVPAGFILPIQVSKVYKDGTSATDIVSIF